MMVGERPRRGESSPRLLDRAEELVRVANAGECEEGTPLDPASRARAGDRVVNRKGCARGEADDRIGGVSFPHPDDGIGMAQLIDQRRPDRTAGNDVAIAQPALRIHDQEPVVVVDAGALETVVHDQEVAPFRDQQPGAGRPVGRHGGGRLRGEQKRLVAG